MRIWTRPVLGNSLETTRFFVNRSMTSRVLLLGLPLLTLVLLLVFLATGRSIEALVNRAIARNAQLHAQAMSLSLEQILTETRNQLLILAAGSMDPKDMVRRLQFRVRAEGLRYREVAFMGTDPSQRYLLLSYGGEIISIPPDIASATVGNPFTSLSAAQRPGHVQISQPLEVVYSMVPLNDSVQSIPLYVIRFSTPIYDSQGVFQGMLILSLDLTVLRDAISMFSSSSAPLRTADDETRIRSIFFDNQGWMLFQSENLEADEAGGRLNSDSLRAGFQGEFGRAGFSTALQPDTCLVSIMFANNEIGTVQPIAELGALCRERGALFHTDAVQAAGHLAIDVQTTNIDLLSLSGHKFHGPKGAGALYTRRGIALQNVLYGGGQERGHRAGTENVPAIAGLAAALAQADANLLANTARCLDLRQRLTERLLAIPGTHLNGDAAQRLPGNVNITFDGVEAETLLLLLDEAGICASAGSACSAGAVEPSHVLLALGLTPAQAKSTLRLTLDAANTAEEIDTAAAVITACVQRLRDGVR